jgi:hypothetical protein
MNARDAGSVKESRRTAFCPGIKLHHIGQDSRVLQRKSGWLSAVPEESLSTFSEVKIVED